MRSLGRVAGRAVLVSAALAAAAAPAGAQAAGTVVIRPYGTLQVQFSSTSIDAEEAGGVPVVPTTFETRRVRLGTEIRVGDAITGRVEPELAMGRLSLRHAWLEYDLGGGFALRAGQFKKPFGAFQLRTNTQLPMIERGVRIRGLAPAQLLADTATGEPVLSAFRGAPVLADEQVIQDVLGYHGYDLGAMLHGRAGRLGLQAGLFNGNGPDQLDDTGAKSAAARVTVALAGPVVLGAATSYREARRDAAGSQHARGWAWTADVEIGEFRRAGPALLAAVTYGDNFAVDDRFVAVQAAASWFAPARFGRFEGVEPIARVGYADPRRDVADDAALLITPGINLYLMGRNRLMLNWDVFVPSGEWFSTQHALRAQAQLQY